MPVCAPFARVWRPIHVPIDIVSHVTVPFNVREIVARPFLKHKSPIMDKLRHVVGPSSLIDAFNSILKFVGAGPCKTMYRPNTSMAGVLRGFNGSGGAAAIASS